MSLYAISDLHLSFAKPKPMDIFDPVWENHAEKLAQNWRQTVGDDDLVLLPGDISWAMDLQELAPDLEFLRSLPGKKLLMPGNHDYWWDSLSKLERAYPDFLFLKNNFHTYEDWAICGARGWICPNPVSFTGHDRKCCLREQIRLKLSLDAALTAGHRKILVLMHFPPFSNPKEPSGFTELLAAYPQVRLLLFGHLHGQSRETFRAPVLNGTLPCQLVSADFLAFTPKKIEEGAKA